MKIRSEAPIDDGLRRLGTCREARYKAADDGDRNALFERVVATPFNEQAASARPALRLWRPLALTAVLCGVLALLLITHETAVTPGTARAFGAIEVREAHGYLTVRIRKRDPNPKAIKRAFAAYGFDIEVRDAAATPGQAGFFVDDERGNSLLDMQGVQPIVDSKRDCNFTQCRYIGLRIPRSLPDTPIWAAQHGPVYVTLGREPRSDSEGYVQLRSAFAPGEVLHCSGLIGTPVAAAREQLDRLGLTVVWNTKSPIGGVGFVNILDPASEGRATFHTESPSHLPAWLMSKYVLDADLTARDEVHVTTTKQKPWRIEGPTGQYLHSLDHGC